MLIWTYLPTLTTFPPSPIIERYKPVKEYRQKETNNENDESIFTELSIKNDIMDDTKSQFSMVSNDNISMISNLSKILEQKN
jgi:hypothetical protein